MMSDFPRRIDRLQRLFALVFMVIWPRADGAAAHGPRAGTLDWHGWLDLPPRSQELARA